MYKESDKVCALLDEVESDEEELFHWIYIKKTIQKT